MNDTKFQMYKDAVLAIYPNANGFCTPTNPGTQNNVLYANVDGRETVFKFSSKALVEKNEAISKLYTMRKIPVPQIVARSKNGLYFEEYPKIQGTPLSEANLSKKQIKRVYRDILHYFERMTRVHPAYLNSNFLSAIHDIAKINAANTQGNTVANLFKVFIYFLNLGGQKSIYHSDIIPKNIIVDKNGNFASFIDMDSVTVCSKEYAFAMMGTKYQEMGFDLSELVDKYKTVYNDSINKNTVLRHAHLLSGGKKIYYKLLRHIKTR